MQSDHPRRTMLKRSCHGTHHKTGPKHLHRHERARGAARHARARHAGPDEAVARAREAGREAAQSLAPSGFHFLASHSKFS